MAKCTDRPAFNPKTLHFNLFLSPNSFPSPSPAWLVLLLKAFLFPNESFLIFQKSIPDAPTPHIIINWIDMWHRGKSAKYRNRQFSGNCKIWIVMAIGSKVYCQRENKKKNNIPQRIWCFHGLVTHSYLHSISKRIAQFYRTMIKLSFNSSKTCMAHNSPSMVKSPFQALSIQVIAQDGGISIWFFTQEKASVALLQTL